MSNILIGVSGGIAAYKACDLITLLRKSGSDVRIIVTEHAKQFITTMTLATLSRHPVMDDMWEERKGNVDHIDIGKWADIFIVYPATANIIAKFANGISDDLLSTAYLALPPKTIKYVFPAMNTNMLEHNSTRRNIMLLRHDGFIVAGTRSTELACGDVGSGAVLSPKDALKLICGEKPTKVFDNPCGEIPLGVPQIWDYIKVPLGGPIPSDVTCGGLENPKDYTDHEVPIG